MVHVHVYRQKKIQKIFFLGKEKAQMLNRFLKVTVGTWPSTNSPGKSAKNPDLWDSTKINILVLSLEDIPPLGSLSCTHVPNFQNSNSSNKMFMYQEGRDGLLQAPCQSVRGTRKHLPHTLVCAHATEHSTKGKPWDSLPKRKFQLRWCNTCVNHVEVPLDGWTTYARALSAEHQFSIPFRKIKHYLSYCLVNKNSH